MSAYSIATRGLAGRKIPQGVLAAMNTLLFGASEQGAWYDPSDLSTLFQDSAGTTPVTAVEQPVGKMLDKSGRGNHALQATTTKRPIYSRRVNLLTKTEKFDDAAWTKTMSGVASAPVVTPNAASAPDGTMTADLVVFTLTGGTSSGDLSQLAQVPSFASGPYRWSFWARTSDGSTKIFTTTDPAGNAILISVVGEYQQFIVTGVGSEFPRIRLRGGEGTASSASIHLWGASLTLAIDAHLPYQRVNTATDYDADPVKFPAYLRFDGVDDALATGSINFTGTDKMTVWAGVTKLSDAGVGIVCELSAGATGAYPGSCNISAPLSASESYRYVSQGSIIRPADYVHSSVGAPHSGVITGWSDIAGDTVTLRINSAQVGKNVSDGGTGTYGNYPLYIGARAGTSLYFNGRLYSLIVRGAQSSQSQIEACELYVKQKMRLP